MMQHMVGDAGEGTQGMRVTTVSTVQAAANALRAMILDGEIKPGTRLRENDFAEQLGIARHSFRAATQILVGEGLLRREPHRGVLVPVLSRADIEDIFKMRAALEIEAVHLVMAEKVVPPGARAAVDALSALGDESPWREVVQPDLDFHRSIIDAGGSARMSRAYRGLQSEITLCMVQLEPVYERPADVAAEHQELLAAIVDADPKKTEQLFRSHLSDAERNQIRALEGQIDNEASAS